MKKRVQRVLNIRKRIDKNRNRVDDRLEIITHVCAVVLPFTTFDQIKLIYIDRKVEGVSAITWFLYAILSFPLLIYSIKKKDNPMIILNGLWLITDTLVWGGVLLYS